MPVAEHASRLSINPAIVNGFCSSRNFVSKHSGGECWFSGGPGHERHENARVDS